MPTKPKLATLAETPRLNYLRLLAAGGWSQSEFGRAMYPDLADEPARLAVRMGKHWPKVSTVEQLAAGLGVHPTEFYRPIEAPTS